jgi:sulfonate transport system permease protein
VAVVAARRNTPARALSDARAQGRAWLVPLGLLVLWFVLTELTRFFPPNQLPSPVSVFRTAVELASDGSLFRHIGASASRVLLGFVIGGALGALVGVAVGVWRGAAQALDPTLQAIRNIPSLAWVPFLLLWLGIDEAPKLTLIAIGAFFPVYVNTVAGIRQTDRKWVEVGHAFGLSRAAQIRRIILPAALPYLLAGLRIGLGQSWLFLVAAELIASTRGLGFMLIDGQNSARPDIMLVSILLLAVLGKLTDSLLQRAEKHLLAWTDGI